MSGFNPVDLIRTRVTAIGEENHSSLCPPLAVEPDGKILRSLPAQEFPGSFRQPALNHHYCYQTAFERWCHPLIG